MSGVKQVSEQCHGTDEGVSVPTLRGWLIGNYDLVSRGKRTRASLAPTMDLVSLGLSFSSSH